MVGRGLERSAGHGALERRDAPDDEHQDEYKSDSELVEVIYGTLDGNIYFLDARTGEYTRDPIELGFP